MSCTCGNQVASNARFCPRCGKRFTRRSVKLLAWFFGIAIGFGVIMAAVAPSNSPISSEEQKQKAKDEHQLQFAVAGAKQLMGAMRNTDSFKLSNALLMGNGTVCYEYRAQNGFGGMHLGHAVLTEKGT